MIEKFEDASLIGNEQIEEVIHLFHQDQDSNLLIAVYLAIRERIKQDGHMIFPADIGEDADGNTLFSFKTMDTGGGTALVAFTSMEEKQKGPDTGAVSQFIDCMLEPLLEIEDIGGLVINPFGESIFLNKGDIAIIMNPGIERFI